MGSISDMELTSAGDHVVENTANIQILTYDLIRFLSLFLSFSFFVQLLQCFALFTIYDYDYFL